MKSRPQYTLVRRQRQRAGDFLNDLGELMFSKTWDTKYMKLLGSEPYEPGTPGAEVFTVQDNFFEAMRLEMGAADSNSLIF